MKRLDAIAITLSLLIAGCEPHDSGPDVDVNADHDVGPEVSTIHDPGPDVTADHDPGPSFSADLVPIMNRHCVMCHMEGGAQGEFSLHPQPYSAMVGAASLQSEMLMVAPGDVEASYFYHKLRGSHIDVGGEGLSMPYPNLLAEQDIAAFGEWIARGAKDN